MNKTLTDTEKLLLHAGATMTGKMLAWRKTAIVSIILNLLMVASYWYGQ
jgi:hypothetical protein